MRLYTAWTPHQVIVEPFAGQGPTGKVYDPPESVDRVYIEDVQEIVLDEQGREVLSLGRVYFNLDVAPPTGSLITVWVGTARARKATAFKVAVFDHPGFPSYATAYLR